MTSLCICIRNSLFFQLSWSRLLVSQRFRLSPSSSSLPTRLTSPVQFHDLSAARALQPVPPSPPFPRVFLSWPKQLVSQIHPVYFDSNMLSTSSRTTTNTYWCPVLSSFACSSKLSSLVSPSAETASRICS